jgi:hypothetical protein
MKFRSTAVLFSCLIVASPVFAAEMVGVPSLGKTSTLSWGGAAPTAEDARVTLWNGGSLAAGVAPVADGILDRPNARGMQYGGFVAWQWGDYRVDATVAPSLGGSVVAGFGAAFGTNPLGTSYGLHFGAARLGERFTVNPGSGLGLAEVNAPASDVNLTFTINHALTPSLNLVGTAEARRYIGLPGDGASALNRFQFGAGLGYRF